MRFVWSFIRRVVPDRFPFEQNSFTQKLSSNANMTNVVLSRMFRGKMRTNTCRIVVLTSIVWLVIDVVLLFHYADFFGVADRATAKRMGEYDVEVSVVNGTMQLIIIATLI